MINKTLFLKQCLDCVSYRLQDEETKVSKVKIKEQLKRNYTDHYSYHQSYFEVLIVRKEYTFKMTIQLTCEKGFNYFTSNTTKRFNSPQEVERYYMQQDYEYRKAGE